MNLILLFILIFVFGFLVTELVAKSLSFIEKAGLSFVLGIALSTFLTFVLSWLGIKITYQSVLALLVVLVVGLAIILRKRDDWKMGRIVNGIRNIKFDRKLSWIEIVLSILILGTILIGLVMNIYYPVREWDALALYDFRAKIIAQEGLFVQVAKARHYDYFAHYPLLTSLSHTFVYLSGVKSAQFIYSLFTISFALVFYGLLRRFVNRAFSLLGVLMLVSNHFIFENTIIAYANLPYAALVVLGFLFLYVTVLKKDTNYIYLGSLLMGLTTWAREEEPFWLIGILLAITIAVQRKRIINLVKFLVPFLIIQQTWRYFISDYWGAQKSTLAQIIAALKAISQTFTPEKYELVMGYIVNNVIIFWGPVLVIFLLAVVINLRSKLRAEEKLLLGIVFSSLILLIFGTIAFSVIFNDWLAIPGSASRMAIFFIPLLIFYFTISVGGDQGLFSSKKRNG